MTIVVNLCERTMRGSDHGLEELSGRRWTGLGPMGAQHESERIQQSELTDSRLI